MNRLIVFTSALLLSLSVFAESGKTIYEVGLNDGTVIEGAFIRRETVGDEKISILMDSTGQEHRIYMKDVQYQKAKFVSEKAQQDDNISAPLDSSDQKQQEKKQSLPGRRREKNLFFSLNIGKSVVYGAGGAPYTSALYYPIPMAQTPTVLSLSLYGVLKSGIHLSFTGGFGFATQTVESKQESDSFTDSHGNTVIISEQYSFSTRKIRGFQTEVAGAYPFAIDRKKKVAIYPGMGLGYVHYNLSGRYEYEHEMTHYTSTNIQYKESWNYSKAVLQGLSLTGILGIEYRVARRTSLKIEVAKLIAHHIKITTDLDWVEYDYEEYNRIEIDRRKIGTETSTYTGQPGLIDVGITCGVKIGL